MPRRTGFFRGGAGIPPSVRRLFRLAPTARRLASELDDELAFHVEARVDELRLRGMSDAEARAEALRRLGDVGGLREYCGALARRRARRQRLGDWCGEWVRDVRFAVRQLARAPGFVAVALASLALGIGATTAIFSAVHHLLIAPLPYPEVNRVVIVEQALPKREYPFEPPAPIATAAVADTRVFASAATYVRNEFAFDGPDGPEMLSGASLSSNVLRTVGMRPILGRGFTAGDTLPGAPAVALLSEGLWRARFGARPEAIGTVLRVNEKPCIVVGVMPHGFTLPWTAEDQLWTPLSPDIRHSRTDVIARLRDGVAVESASREIGRLAASLPLDASVRNADERTVVHLAALEKDRVVRADGLRPALIILFVVVGLLLLIACANVANLLLAHTAARQRELAIRAALGAGRGRLLRLVLSESLLLALAGGALGILVGWEALHVIIALRPQNLDELSGVHLEWVAVWWSFGASLVAALVFGVAPALFAGSADVSLALRGDARVMSGSRSAARFRTTMVVAEMALSVVLLVSAGLLVRSVLALEHVDPGMDTHGLTVLWPRVGSDRLSTPDAVTAAEHRLLEVVRALPEVRGATLALVPPPNSAGVALEGLAVDGRDYGVRQPMPPFGINLVDPEYFRTVGLTLRQGRVFTTAPRDTSFRTPREVVVSESFAREFWPTGGAVGRVVRGLPHGPVMTVVGVVSDERMAGAFNHDHHAQLYSPLLLGQHMISLVVRSQAAPGKLAPEIAAAIAAAGLPIIVRRVDTVDDEIGASIAPSRFVALLFGAFAALAFAMAVVGLYGVISYAVGQRRRELGVRMALGASRPDVVRLVLRDGMRLACAGTIVGLAAAALATRALRTLLFGIRPGDPDTYVLVLVVLLATAAAAAYVPARRATRADPLHTLRSD